MKRTPLAAAVALFFLAWPMLSAAQDAGAKPVTAEVRYLQHQRSVTVTNSGQACAPLDSAVFAHSNPMLGDLRLYTAGREVPYTLYNGAPLSTSQSSQPDILNTGQRGNRITFDADMKPAGVTPSYSDLEVKVTAANFIASVIVSGSQSVEGSATRLGTYTIFDLTSQKLGRSTILHLPPSNFPWLHFEVTGPLKPADITGLTIPSTATRTEVFTQVAVAGPPIQKGHSTVFTLELPAKVPVTHIEFVPPAGPVNFSRGVTVQSATATRESATEDTPPATYTGTISRVHMLHNGDHLDDESLALDVNAVGGLPSTTRWTIIVDNGDDPPINWAAVRLEMLQTNLCFDALTSAQPYTLMYGDSALAAPHYDYASLFQAEGKPAAAMLGPEQANLAYQPRSDQRPFTEQHPALLWSALVLVILVLGVIAVRSGKRLHSS